MSSSSVALGTVAGRRCWLQAILVGVRVADSRVDSCFESKVDSGLLNRPNRLNRRSDSGVASTVESDSDSDYLIKQMTLYRP
jgi:hypothetical protein